MSTTKSALMYSIIVYRYLSNNKTQRKRMRGIMFKQIIVLVIILMISCICINAEESRNLIKNPGFEKAGDKAPRFWSIGKRDLKGDILIVSDIKHSGEKSVYIKSTSKNLNTSGSLKALEIYSNFVKAPTAGIMLQVSIWLKSQNVISPGKWFKCRFTICFADKKEKVFKHYDIASLDGTTDWKKIIKKIVIPKGSKYFKVICLLSNCSGEAWFDDIVVSIAPKSLAPNKKDH
jgi:hypothetical protein